MREVSVIVGEALATCGAPNGAAGCAVRLPGGARWARATGGEVDTIFDLASVSKPMTAVAVARSGIDRAAPIGTLLPEVQGTTSAKVPLELLLAHRAGLAAHAQLWAPLLRGEAVDPVAALVEAAQLRHAPPDADALYSDLGYILAGAALARHCGTRDAGDAIARLVVEPMGLAGSLGTAAQLGDAMDRAAPTELAPWRGGVVRGEVHDENAWALTGKGGSGHAGMFGTIDAVLTFGATFLDWLDADPHAYAWLVRERAGGTLRAGFDGKSAEGSSAGSRMSARAFGHLGFTGTSLWIDPDAKVVVSLLTNRVHPTRDNQAIRAARPPAHDALYDHALTLRDGGGSASDAGDRD
jgi:CubicO group peptidase (beta-lactamase class C family)